MATKTKKSTTKKATKAAKPDPVDEEIEELELDDLEEDEEGDDEAPAKATKSTKKSKAKATKKAPAKPEVWGTKQLAAYIAEETGNEYKPKELRVLLRKMAAEGELDWEVSQGSGSRYSWDGPDDAEVQQVLEYVQGGAIEEARAAALEKLKEQQAAKREANAKKGTKSTKGKKGKAKKAEPEPEELDDDLEELEDLEDEDE